MSNKTDLQANNARIEAFIQDGQDLPPALPDELGNATTADVLNGKTFTSDDGVMQTGGLAPNGFGSAVATDVLIGKTFSSATGIFQNGGLDPDTLKKGNYVWKELTAEGGEFRKYVVSDNESAYPDGGEKDGFWYERYIQSASGQVTTSAKTKTLSFEHGLDGEVAFILTRNDPPGNVSNMATSAIYPITSRDKTNCISIVINASNIYYTSDYVSFTNENGVVTITLSNSYNFYFPASATFKWHAMKI